jgi:hypothetical protein
MAKRTAKPADSMPAKPPPGPAADRAKSQLAAKPGPRPNVLIGGSLAPVTAQTRRRMIAEAAYYMAQQRGFAQGGEIEDWLLAEKQIDAVISA